MVMYELLIVDDETSTRNLLAACFPWEQLGFQVCSQKDSGAEALEFLKDHIVHVILTDIRMDGMNGIDLAQEIFLLPPPRPIVVFLSAYDNFKYAQDAIRYGVRYYLLKPASFSELKEVFGTIRAELDIRYQIFPDTLSQFPDDEIIHQVLEYLNHNYKDGSLSQLAGNLFLNASYLSQLIKLKTEKTFSDLLTEARMKQAALLLKNPDVKIYNISSAVGYLNPNNFARAFKAYWGLTPTEYRINEKRKLF